MTETLAELMIAKGVPEYVRSNNRCFRTFHSYVSYFDYNQIPSVTPVSASRLAPRGVTSEIKRLFAGGGETPMPPL